ncbi:MAG TPA: hypothetical protein PK333_04130, partial [Candidatus Moranbacteria bacterium]|nr:hypothetical protein [Candidatus Moranbacteria bacterium]HSA08088.1 hypothetical protein [Candidatus Moranbacteria bacterium]
MTLKSYLWGMRIGALIALAAWVLVILNIDPDKSGIVGQILFYVSTFLLFAGIAIIFFTRVRRFSAGNDEDALCYLGTSFRQGILTSILIVGLMILQQNRILTWWDGALVVVGILLVELYFLTRK